MQIFITNLSQNLIIVICNFYFHGLKLVCMKDKDALMELEKLRMAWQANESSISSAYDFLDRGAGESKNQIFDEINILNERNEVVLLRLETLIRHYRENNPRIINDWVDLHLKVVDQIVREEEKKEHPDSTIEHVAGDIREKWEEFRLEGEIPFYINEYYLKGYDHIIHRFLPQ